MHCSSCALNIDGELEDVEGIFEASTSYAKATTKVRFDPKKVDKKKLVNAIEVAGYKVSI